MVGGYSTLGGRWESGHWVVCSIGHWVVGGVMSAAHRTLGGLGFYRTLGGRWGV